MVDDLALNDVMSFDDFLAFTETRPDDEKWELIDGEAILNGSPNKLHQRIVRNLIFELELAHRSLKAPWEVIRGVTVHISRTDAPVPDVMIRPKDRSTDNVSDDMIVPSRSFRRRRGGEIWGRNGVRTSVSRRSNATSSSLRRIRRF